MAKNNRQFDGLEDFLENNQHAFLKNFQKDAEKVDWTESLYKPLGKETGSIFSDEDEGQLALDVFQKNDKIVIYSAIAGIDPDKLDISLHNDILTIRGERKMDETVEDENYFYKECYWGKFSRSIILPTEVKAEEISATIKNGILKIVLPKANPQKKIKIKVIDEES